MSANSGVSEQILSLPKGGGSIKGLGETFEPQLHTGAGSYAVPIDIPNGPNDIAPKLTLLYSTGTGNTPFGMGFSLNLFTISRSVDKRMPTYDDAKDQLVLLGGGELVDKGGGSLVVKNAPHNWQIHKEGEGFRLTDRDGKYYRLGITEQAQLFTTQNGVKKTFQWFLEEVEDSLGNKVKFTYQRDHLQLYLSKVDYSIYSVVFKYEDRPDPVLNGKAGYLIRTHWRCKEIELHLTNATQSLLRRWNLSYKEDFDNWGHSLISQIVMSGFDENGASLQLPTLQLDYTNFKPRKLEKFKPSYPTAAPDGLADGRRELIDWNGNGIPDLIELNNGGARIWENSGDMQWDRPRQLDDLPVPVNLDQPGVAFADMEGNGTADLIMLNRPLSGYYPHKPGGGFDLPVFWRQSPSIPLSDPDSILVDMDGDGIADLLVTRDDYFSIYLRSAQDGWNPSPITIPRLNLPPVNLRDPHVFVADMTGDGSQDLVRVDGRGVIFWAYLGNGRWSEGIPLSNRLTLPRNFDPARLFLTDIDGDGIADFVYVDYEQVIYWLNQGGTKVSAPRTIDHTPPAQPNSIRLADMKGSGTKGVLWSYANNITRATDYLYLDFSGNSKPYLLSNIDNGLGSDVTIAYSNSCLEEQRDRANGNRWKTFLPFSVPVVKSIAFHDQVTEVIKKSVYNYHEGHYDGISREFSGFGKSEILELGDDSIPDLQTINHYHLGLDENNIFKHIPKEEAERLKVLRGRLLKTEIYEPESQGNAAKLYMRSENDWDYRVEDTIGDQEILFAFMKESRKSFYEGEAEPFRIQIEKVHQYDAFGNPTHQEQIAVDPRDESLTKSIETIFTYAQSASKRYLQKPARTIQKNENDEIIATTISYYDNKGEGELGEDGFLSKQRTLVLTDDIVQSVYADTPPDLEELGYFRMQGESGWWIDKLTYTNGKQPSKLEGSTTNALGNTTRFFFDEFNIHAIKIVDALGNENNAVYDYRANKVSKVIDANNITIENQYDALGRLKHAIHPGTSAAAPSVIYDYQISGFPVSIRTDQRTKIDQDDFIRGKVFLDGFGNTLEERSLSGVKTIEKSQLFNARGLVTKQFLPHAAPNDNYQIPDAALSHQQITYDAIGRIVSIARPNGATLAQKYEPGIAFIYDEEDTNPDPLAKHKETPKRHTFDPTGRVIEVADNDAGKWITTRFLFDVKGNLLSSTNALGQTSTFKYDLLGNRLQTNTPESGISTFVFDANGNQRERKDIRGEVVKLQYDELDRLIRTSSGDGSRILTTNTYDDTDRPAPSSNSTSKGKLVKVEHEGGEETFVYNEQGEISSKTIKHNKVNTATYTFDYSYRHDGKLDTVILPNTANNPARLSIRYEYDARGRLLRIPNYIKVIKYHPTGLRAEIEYANGVKSTYTYDELTMRLGQLHTENTNNGSVYQNFAYSYDKTGNILSIQSNTPDESWLFEYDNLYRLTKANKGTNQTWNYTYNDLGDFLSKSDVGNYEYDANGRLSVVNGQAITYTAAGQMQQTPWGEYTFDLAGRLAKVEKDGEEMNCMYNQRGKRIWMKVSGNEGDEIFTPDPMLTVKNGVAYAYLFDGNMRVAQIRLDDTATSFLHNDHLGSLSIVTSSAGDIIQKMEYAPFGERIENTIAPNAEGIDYTYTGQLFDEWAELSYLNSRYYNPKIGRFISADTMVPEMYETQSWNRYSYVQNNPLRYIDPTGHFWEEIGDWFKDNWKAIVTAVVAVAIIVATIALTIVTFGVGGVLAGVIIGMAIGGVVGGVSAGLAGGSVGDILLGILVGVAVGGATSLAGAGIGAGISSVISSQLLSSVLTGALSGAVSGAGAGFVAGFASGSSAGEIWKKVWQGALIGFATGAILGLASHFLNKAGILDKKLGLKAPDKDEVTKALAETAKRLGEQGNAGAIDPGALATTAATELGKSAVEFGGNSGIALLGFLKPEFIGVTTSIFGSATSYVVLEFGEDILKLIDGEKVSSPKIEF